MKIFIIIPFHNEKNHIGEVIKGVAAYKLPIILVDDGSTDGSATSLRSKKVSNVTLLTHKVNLGKGSAMKTGADYAFKKGADAIIFMDGDNQHMPGDIPKFIKGLESKKAEVVFGSRNFGYGVPLVRFLGNKIASIIVSTLFHIYVSDLLCGFRALTKKAYNKIRWDSAGYGVETEMVARIGKEKIKFTEVPVASVYHSKVKGVTILDAAGILFEVIKWKFTL